MSGLTKTEMNNLVKEFLNQHKQQKETNLIEVAEEFLDKNEIRYVAHENFYHVKTKDGDWTTIKPVAMKNFYPEWRSKGFPEAITEVLQKRGRSYQKITYSFRNISSDILNLMDKTTWITPKEGAHHWLFDTILQSLGGGKQENINHLEHVIAYKYTNPECYMLPCIIIHGEGGVGKNLLVDKVLKTLFGGQTYSAVAKNVIGSFNSMVKGKTVVMIDESKTGKTDENELKHLLQRETLTINEKGTPQYEIDNTPLYFVSSNKSDGGVWLDRSNADRRYSVLHVKKGQPIQYWISIHNEWIDKKEQCSLDEHDTIHKKATEWLYKDGSEIVQNPEEVAKWINHLIVKWKDKPQPTALHGEDFNRLLSAQTPMHERVVLAVFNDPKFTHIKKRILYRIYKINCAEGNNNHFKTDAKFYHFVRDWLGQNNRFAENLSGYYFKKKTGDDSLKDNDALYINHMGQYTGPDLSNV